MAHKHGQGQGIDQLAGEVQLLALLALRFMQ